MTAAGDSRNTTRNTDGRFRLRAYLWQDFPRADSREIRVSSCGRTPVGGMVEVRASGDASGLGGLSTCGSVWVCPVCSPKIAATRSGEVRDTIRAWQQQGGSVLLMTVTLSHDVDTPLAASWDAVGRGWESIRNGNPWKRDAAAFGIAGYLRVIEVTRSKKNGWHPHAHVVLFVTGTPTDQDCEALRERVYGRWSRRLAKEGFRTLDFDASGKAVGVDVRRADAATVEYLAEYLTKFGYTPRTEATGLALEVSRGDLKSGRKGSRTPWEILEDAHGGDAASVALWDEWERVSQGRRQYAWALGFRESLDVESIRSDQEAAEAEDARLEVVALLRRPVWRVLVDDLRRKHRLAGAPLMTMMLGKAADLDPDQFRDWMTRRGIEWVHPDLAGAVEVVDLTTGEVLTVDGTHGHHASAGLLADPSMVRVYRRRQSSHDRHRAGALPDHDSMLARADARAAFMAGLGR